MFQRKNCSVGDLCQQINVDSNWLHSSQIVESQLKKAFQYPLLVKTEQFFFLDGNAPYSTHIEAIPLKKNQLEAAKALVEMSPSELQELGLETFYVRHYPERFRRETSYSVMTPYEFLQNIERGASSQSLFESLESMTPLFKAMGLQEMDLSRETMTTRSHEDSELFARRRRYEFLGHLETGCVVISLGLISAYLALIAADQIDKMSQKEPPAVVKPKDAIAKPQRQDNN